MRRQHYIKIYNIITKQGNTQVVSLSFALPQSLKFFVESKKYFLIGKDFSYLKSILPTMDHEMGGGCS